MEVHPLLGVVMVAKWAVVTRCQEQQGLKWTMGKVKTVESRRPPESVKALKKRTRVGQRDTLLHVVDKKALGKSKCFKVHPPLCVHCVSTVHPPLCVPCTPSTVCPLYILHCVSAVHPPLCVPCTPSTVCPLYTLHCVSTVHPPLCPLYHRYSGGV